MLVVDNLHQTYRDASFIPLHIAAFHQQVGSVEAAAGRVVTTNAGGAGSKGQVKRGIHILWKYGEIMLLQRVEV